MASIQVGSGETPDCPGTHLTLETGQTHKSQYGMQHAQRAGGRTGPRASFLDAEMATAFARAARTICLRLLRLDGHTVRPP